MKLLLLVCIGLIVGASAFAQVQDPTSWSYETKKKTGNEYELVFHLKLKEGWHIWALQPGGDGLEIAPSFTFEKDANVQLKGKVKEAGTPTVTKIEGIDGKVKYFEKQVDFIQDVVVKGPVMVKGTHEYQVCNESICLPPKDKEFSFNIK